MSKRLQNALQGLILVGLALFLAHSIINGTLLFYISPRFAWLTWVATILLLLMAFTRQRMIQLGFRRFAPQRDEHDHQHPNHHNDGENWWVALLLVALPLLLGLLVPPQPLGAQAVGKREVNSGGLGLGGEDSALTLAAEERDILDWLRAFGAADDLSAFDGQEATVIGFVYRDKEFAADQFMVSRFVITCCVADATVLGLVVSWPHSLDLPLDAWVEVHGTFQPDQVDGWPMPILLADSVTPTVAPNQPYLYP